MPRTSPAARHSAFGLVLGQGQRLFAKDVLAGSDGRFDLRSVQGMGGRKDNRLNRLIAQRICIVCRQCDILVCTQAANSIDIGPKRQHRA